MRRRRLLLLLPALQQLRDRPFRLIKYARFPPLSLLTLAGMTPEERWEVVVRDEAVEPLDAPGHFDLVGIQTYISSAPRAYELAALHRARGSLVVLGGLHPTSMPDEAGRHADAVCVGPAETVWPQILADAELGRLQRIYRGSCVGSAALVPLPRRDLLNQRCYLLRHTMVTSRGCPHSCSFCYKAAFWGEDYYETLTRERIARELDGVDDGLVFFLDDNLLGNRRHGRMMLELLQGRGLLWQAAASLDVARDPAYLAAAYQAGCRSLFVGFESLSPASLRAADKRVNLAADYGEAVRRFHDAGIMVNGSFVFGFDGDGPDVFERTVDFAIEHKIETATFHILTPFPGTRAFAALEQDGRLLHRRWEYYDTDHAVFRPARMSPEQLEQGHRWAYEHFLRYGSILRRSVGLPGAAKRVAYNVAWMKVDPVWELVVRAGLMPWARGLLTRVLGWASRRPVALRAPALLRKLFARAAGERGPAPPPRLSRQPPGAAPARPPRAAA